MEKYTRVIKDFFAKIKTKKILYVKKSINPTHDWNIFVSFSLLIFILGFIFSLYFYNQVNSGNWFFKSSNSSVDKLVKINQTLLDKIIQDINIKQVSRDNISKNVPKDPSI